MVPARPTRRLSPYLWSLATGVVAWAIVLLLSSLTKLGQAPALFQMVPGVLVVTFASIAYLSVNAHREKRAVLDRAGRLAARIDAGKARGRVSEKPRDEPTEESLSAQAGEKPAEGGWSGHAA